MDAAVDVFWFFLLFEHIFGHRRQEVHVAHAREDGREGTDIFCTCGMEWLVI